MKANTEKMQKIMTMKLYNNATLAAACGVSANTISRIKNGTTEPRIETLEKICKALDCEPKDLM